ncbi:MAG: tetratricopeptide repeat protein [candidate division Zixibacteria bacterium]|nr:tetratricopeptide repeat protein [candidate division Zixibacteria bacterium]
MSVSLKKLFKYSICIIAIWLSLATIVWAEHEASDSIMVFSGELIASRQLVEAESVLSEAIWEDPEYAPLYIQRGIIFGMQTKFKQAIPDFTKGIELDPKMPEAYYSRGLAYSKTKDDDNALKDYNKTIELNPGYASAYYNRGLISFRKANYDIAFDDFTKTVELNPNYAKAYYNLGAIYDLRAIAAFNKKDSTSMDIRNKNLELEIENYNKAIGIDSKYIDAIYNRGLAYLKTSVHDKAEKDFLRTIFLDPKSRDARFNLGVTYERMKKYGDAKKQYEMYLKNATAVDSLRIQELTDKFPQMERWQNRLDSSKVANEEKSE